MKICVIGTRGFPQIEGGVEKHCEQLYPLLRKDIETVVFRRKPYIKSNSYHCENIKFVDLPSTRIKGLETVIHSFISTVVALFMKPDAVHYHNIGPALFAPLLKLRKIPIVLTYHSPNYEHDKWNAFSKSLLKFSESVALKCANKIIFVSEYQLKKQSPEVQKKSVYIPNGIPKPCFSQKHDYLDELGIKPKKYILSVGRITQEKGFDTLIKGYLNSDHGDYKLVIAGGVEFESVYKQKLDKLRGDAPVIFTGYIYGEKLAQLYTNAALYIISSNNEGFPIVLLEAMSYNLDVLASDIPATHLVRLNDDAYFPKGDYKLLGQKIEERLQNPQNRTYDLSAFDWNKVAEQVSMIFDEVTRSGGKELIHKMKYTSENNTGDKRIDINNEV